ncbi:MAG: 7-cyano-7-deazaguanine synthase [Phycisphaerae bacterium]|jgi:7-cyano-7-deazaguanine synthase
MAKVVVLASGGIKSAVAAACSGADNELVFLHVHYGQQSATAEREALRAFGGSYPSSRVLMLGLPHFMQLEKATLGAGDELAGVADARSGGRGAPALPRTSLRGLMPIMLLVAVQTALRLGASKVLTGLTQFGDAAHLALPRAEGARGDRREFLHSFTILVESVLPERTSVAVEAPLIDLVDAEVVKLAKRFDIPFEKTWSCEQSGPKPCGTCSRCTARADAFVKAGLVDPLGTGV